MTSKPCGDIANVLWMAAPSWCRDYNTRASRTWKTQRRHSLPPQKVSGLRLPRQCQTQDVPYRITAAGLHGKASLVCGYNAAKGSRQCSRVTWEEAVAPQAEPVCMASVLSPASASAVPWLPGCSVDLVPCGGADRRLWCWSSGRHPHRIHSSHLGTDSARRNPTV